MFMRTRFHYEIYLAFENIGKDTYECWDMRMACIKRHKVGIGWCIMEGGSTSTGCISGETLVRYGYGGGESSCEEDLMDDPRLIKVKRVFH